MRTTVDLADDAFYVARAHASARKISLGKAISELILQPRHVVDAEVSERRSKYPSVRVGQVLTDERVKELLDGE